MPFTIEITQVGEAEFPLIRVLAEHIFGPQLPRQILDDALISREQSMVLIAHLESNPVGFSIGRMIDAHTYQILLLGMLSEYRRQGHAGQMLQMHERFARSCCGERVQIELVPDCAQASDFLRRRGYHAGDSGLLLSKDIRSEPRHLPIVG